MARIDFDTEQDPPSSNDFEPIPAGEYLLALEKSETKPTKAGSAGNPGLRLAVTYVVVDGDYRGRKLFSGFNLVNDNPKAVEISKGQLSSLIRACGKVTCDDSEELHGIAFLGKVKVTPAKPPYEAGNEVVGFKPADGSAPAAPSDKIVAKAAAPWGKK